MHDNKEEIEENFIRRALHNEGSLRYVGTSYDKELCKLNEDNESLFIAGKISGLIELYDMLFGFNENKLRDLVYGPNKMDKIVKKHGVYKEKTRDKF